MTAFLPPLWSHYSRLLIERILAPRNAGTFPSDGVIGGDMRVVIGQSGREQEKVALYFAVDTTDGIIADAKFQALGTSALIGAADAACDVVLRKSHAQAGRITANLIDQKLRDFSHIPAFPSEANHALNLVLEAIDHCIEQCRDIAIADPSYAPPVPTKIESDGEYPQWEAMTNQEKLALINQVIADEIQPYIELDAGGIEVLALREDREVIIAYQGACTSCPSATGATLHAIEQILRAKVHPNLGVKPDLSFLSF
ncbi:MAG: NifU family protein [Chlamydiota bacterium]